MVVIVPVIMMVVVVVVLVLVMVVVTVLGRLLRMLELGAGCPNWRSARWNV